MTDHIPVKAVIASGVATALAEFEPGDKIPSQYIDGLMGSNMLINCGVPVINQSGFSGGALSAGAYGYDMWKAGAGGCNVTINPSTGVFTHTSGPLQQIVEAPEAAWGLPLTLSLESPSGSVSVSVGGASGTISAGSGRRSVTLTPTGSGNMTVQLTASGVTYSQPRLERGSVATSPEYRGAAIELLLCQRHYEIFFLGGTNGTINAANQVLGIGVTWNVEKRAIPSISLVPGSDVATAFPVGLASFNNIDKRSAIAFKMSTGGSSNAGWYQAVAIDARL